MDTGNARAAVSYREFVHMGVAAGLSSFVGYAVVNFFPSYVVRSFGMGLAELGVWLGLIVGIAGGVGYFGGGVIADRLGRDSRRKSFNFLAVSMIVSTACYVAVFMAQSAAWTLAMLVLPSVIAGPLTAATRSIGTTP